MFPGPPSQKGNEGAKNATLVFPLENTGEKQHFVELFVALGHFLETSLPGALSREFREFMRILTTFLGKTHRDPPESGVSAVCAIFQGMSSDFA